MQYSYVLVGLAAVASAQEFTSIFNITATPDQVISNAGASAPGPAGAIGQFNYAINSKTDVICYDITLVNFVGPYQSPAKTATHLHEGAKGKAGPPRIAFPNPVGDDKLRKSSGCLVGPFTTGLKMADNVTDTGAGFRLAQIEANPAGFFTDSHSALFPAGVVRGQLDQKFEFIPQKPEGYPVAPPPKPEGYPVAPPPKPEGYPVAPPAYPVDPPAYPVDPPAYPVNKPKPGYPVDGDKYTTATYTKTVEYTISSCKQEVVDCPYKTKPVVTKTEEVYTTVCPVSELPKVYKTVETVYPVETHPAYDPSKPVVTYPVDKPGKPVETHPVYDPSKPVVTYPVDKPGKPVETHPAGPVYTIETYPVGKPTPVQTYQPTGSSPAYPVFTGAAASNKVGGLLIAAGLAAALL
ncbi:hypothetical protein VTL71DRAFT_1239 [Oculimacula yallundae]|uniref:CHRD domain-containing protein n=1 Tax=Oculimacula yallundae TaxID=86028 RepID=A0ABR4CA64_9HELO